MDVITIAKRMNHRINALRLAREGLKSLAEAKALAISQYERELAVTILRIRNGMEVELDGYHITNPPVTIIEKIAKGKCWEKKLEMEKAEAFYKAEIVNMAALGAELNGYQSINKYIKDDINE
jgi:hypothetical protein